MTDYFHQRLHKWKGPWYLHKSSLWRKIYKFTSINSVRRNTASIIHKKHRYCCLCDAPRQHLLAKSFQHLSGKRTVELSPEWTWCCKRNGLKGGTEVFWWLKGFEANLSDLPKGKTCQQIWKSFSFCCLQAGGGMCGFLVVIAWENAPLFWDELSAAEACRPGINSAQDVCSGSRGASGRGKWQRRACLISGPSEEFAFKSV